MGTLRSKSDCTGMSVNGIALGEPTFADEIIEGADSLFAWDDPRLPNGFVGDDGDMTIDEVEGI